jgi:hypothetical protein
VTDELVNLRYVVDDVEEAVAFYTTHELVGPLSSSRTLPRTTSANARCLVRAHGEPEVGQCSAFASRTARVSFGEG